MILMLNGMAIKMTVLSIREKMTVLLTMPKKEESQIL